MNLVYNQKMFDEFVENVLPSLAPGELYFVSLSARNKYLTAQEREYYQLGRTEMFGRTTCSGDWDYTMRKLGSVLEYKRTRNGKQFPKNSLVVYVNINPVNTTDAAMNFAKSVMDVASQALSSYSSGNMPNQNQLIKAERMLMNEMQKATGTRHLVDIDVDSRHEYYVNELTEHLEEHGVVHNVIKTQGGFHVLVNRKSLNAGKTKLHEVVQRLNKEVQPQGGEVMFNGNGMVPMPGTLQAGKLVELVR